MNIAIGFLVGVSVTAVYCLLKYVNSGSRFDLSSVHIVDCSLTDINRLFSKLKTANLPAGKHVVDGHEVILNENGQCIWTDVTGICGPAAYIDSEQKI